MPATIPARMVTLTSIMLALPVLALLLLATEAAAKDWPQFRGPNRDGNWDEKGVLASFPREGLKSVWKHPVGGGWASPVVANGRVFVLDVELIKPTARERLHCFEEKTGKILWVYAYDEPYSDWTYVPERGAGPTATPIVEQERIYFVGANGNTHCLEVKSGGVIWEKNIGKEYQVAEMSCRPSPLIEGSLLIVFTGAKPGASLLALDKKTGKEVWKALDDLVSNSSPVVITDGGTRQLIVWSNNALTSLDPANGHVYWRELMSTSGNDSTATPVVQGNRLLVSGLMMDLSSNSPAATFRWPENRVPTKRVLSNTSSPVLQGELIYSARSPGDLVCLEAATGKQVWSTNCVTTPKNGASINITPQGDGFYLFTDEGNLIRAQLSASGYREISRTHLIEPTWPFNGTKFVYAPPAFANDHIFVRNEAEIICASLEREQ
jgi:outer membrane protein assembly factor BamB